MKALLPIVLSAKTKTWRSLDQNFMTSTREWTQVRHQVLRRDEDSCRFCGFTAKSWQELHHLDDDHNNNAMENLVTACAFCHMDHHIGLAGLTDSAKLAWLPELNHAEINHLARTRLVLENWLKKQPAALQGDAHALKMAAQTYDAMMALRTDMVRRHFGSDSPIALGHAIIAIEDGNQDPQIRTERLAGIRMVPTGTLVRGDKGDTAPYMVAHWLEPSGAYASMQQPQSWLALFRQHAQRFQEM